MKHTILSLCIALTAAIFNPVIKSVDAATCPRTNSGEVDLSQLVVDPNGADFNCDYTPDGMRIKLYQILLCEELPTLANYNSICKKLVDFSSGKVVSITANGTSPIIDGPVTLTEGNYSHAAILIENKIGSLFTQTFSQPIHGSNGVGKTCWSNGNDAKIWYPGGYTEFSASCGLSSAANPQWSTYTYKGFWTPGGYVNTANQLTATGSGKDVYLLGDVNTVAAITYDGNGFGEQNLTTQANYLLGVAPITPIAKVTPNTSNVDLGFKLTDTFFQKITTSTGYNVGVSKTCSSAQGTIGASPDTGAHACLATSYAQTFDFRFVVD